MSDLSIFKIDSQTINIKDTTARQTAESAKTLATTASGNATTALNKINKLESEKADKTLATTSSAGLMSASDKSKLDGIGAGAKVKSVNGKTGVVSLSKADVGLGNVDNTSDANKHVRANNIQWGGNNIAGNISPLDVATSNLFSGNVMAYSRPAGITVEYSTDGGTTWADYGADDNSKIRLVTPEVGGANYYLGKKNDAQTATKDLLRISLDARKMGIYCNPKSMLIYISTGGGAGGYVDIEYSIGASDTVFHNFGRYGIAGWSGWNSIPINNIYTFGSYNNSDDHPAIIRLTFGFTGYHSKEFETKTKFSVYTMSMIATNRWITPSNMASVNSIYRLDVYQNATFPAKVTATSFAGATATSSADGLMSKSDKSKLDGIGAGSNVKSVNGKTGGVNLSKADVGLGNVANLDQSKAIKSITRNGTTFTATALDGTTTTFTQEVERTTEALNKINELEKLSRVSISYDSTKENMTITIGTHSVA